VKLKILLVSLVLGCVGFTWPSSIETIPRKAVGLQLYSLRDQFKKDVAATLDQVRAFGVTNVELPELTASRLRSSKNNSTRARSKLSADIFRMNNAATILKA
jgi:hypothetical protein